VFVRSNPICSESAMAQIHAEHQIDNENPRFATKIHGFATAFLPSAVATRTGGVPGL
jgi:hypothetical protein